MINFRDKICIQKPLLLCVALGIPAAGHALTFDVRGGYRAGSHSYESAIRSVRVANRLVGEYGDG
jgi:hypothetical protein